ncbi:MAG: LysE family translocator [Desulfobacterales bacterium]|nr:LysE family translocator [Desulfobacterales bacterium]
MKTFLLLLVIYSLGFLSAIPIGPAQIEIAKRSLHNHLRAAMMVALGSFSSDIMYGVIALFGVAPFFNNQKAVAIFELCGTVILWILAFFTLKEGTRPHLLEFTPSFLKSRRIAFITGFSLSVVNPMMIFWWLVGVQIVRHINLVDTFTPTLSFFFVLFGAMGLATYLTALAVAFHWAKKFFSNKAMQRIYVALGIALIMLSLYFLINSLRILFG